MFSPFSFTFTTKIAVVKGHLPGQVQEARISEPLEIGWGRVRHIYEPRNDLASISTRTILPA
jgi:hypothetical protein